MTVTGVHRASDGEPLTPDAGAVHGPHGLQRRERRIGEHDDDVRDVRRRPERRAGDDALELQRPGTGADWTADADTATRSRSRPRRRLRRRTR